MATEKALTIDGGLVSQVDDGDTLAVGAAVQSNSAGLAIKPFADSTTSVQVQQAGGTGVAAFDTTNGRLRVGDATAPTARVHLPAGTTSAGSAPIKLTSGTAMSSAEDGALEYHSSHLYFTIGSTRYQLDQQTTGSTGFTAEGGFYVTLVNKTGESSVKGKLVKCSPTTDNAVELNSIDAINPVGVIYDAGVADGSNIRVVVGGIADVLIEAADSIVRDYWIGSGNATAGRARSITAPPGSTEHWRECGHVLESKTNTGNTTVKCVIHFN